MMRHFANMVFALILIAYTVYAALDTFVIVRVLTPDTLPTASSRTQCCEGKAGRSGTAFSQGGSLSGGAYCCLTDSSLKPPPFGGGGIAQR